MSTVTDLSSGFSLGAAFPPLPVCRFTVEKYEEMIRAGIINEDDPIELLDGWITPKMTKKRSPCFVVGISSRRNRPDSAGRLVHPIAATHAVGHQYA